MDLEQTKKETSFISRLFGRKKKESFDCMKTLETFTANYDHVVALPQLKKVDEKDLNNWFHEHGITNGRERKKKVNTLSQKLKREYGEAPWDMSDVEFELKEMVESLLDEVNPLS